MKRMVSLLLAMIMAFSLAACSKQTADMYCTSCGHGLAKSVSFCDECGARVATVQENDSIDASEAEKTSKVSEGEKEKTTTAKKSTTTKKTTTTTKKSTIAKSTTTTNKTTVTKPTTTTTKKASTTKPTTTTTTTKKTTATPTTTHKHSYAKEVTPATCTEKGYTTYTCSCGHSYKDNYTNPSHEYENYVCKSCGIVDETHAYEYLEEWIRRNGKTNGTHIRYEYFNEGVTYSLNYSAQSDSLYICSCEYKNDAFVYASLYLDDYGYLVSIEDYELTELFGYISASSYTSESPISYTKYNGDANIKHTFIELSRLSIDRLIEWLDWMLEREEIGVSLSDLGFKSYQ